MTKSIPAAISASIFAVICLCFFASTETGELFGQSTKQASKPLQANAEEKSKTLPDGFSYVSAIDPSIEVDLKYASTENFVGQKIDGYKNNRAILTTEACKALKKVQQELKGQELGLKIFDAYRPKQAVKHFVDWASSPANETKSGYYPNYTKEELFATGFIAKSSGHSRGSSVDLTIIDLKTGKERPMGTHFDFFDWKSTEAAAGIDEESQSNRSLLRSVMKKHGFKPYRLEWWHFSLAKEPFPDTEFDFEVQ